MNEDARKAKAEKELLRYRKGMAKKLAKEVSQQPVQQQPSKPMKGQQHAKQQKANAFEDQLRDLWRSVPEFWADGGRRRRGVNLWMWGGIAVIFVWMLALFAMPAPRPRSAGRNPLNTNAIHPQGRFCTVVRQNLTPITAGVAVTKLLQGKRMAVTKHGACRMDCRKVTDDEISSLVRTGWVNAAKSDAREVPCPVYALETAACHTGNRCRRMLRAVVAACGYENRLVTVIDLKQDHTCWCS